MYPIDLVLFVKATAISCWDYKIRFNSKLYLRVKDSISLKTWNVEQ